MQLILVRGDAWTDTVIRWAQGLRGCRHADVTHVALLAQGTVYESVSSGTRAVPWDTWTHRATCPYETRPLVMPDAMEQNAVRYLQWVVVHRDDYDWFTILSDGLHLLTGGLISLSLEDGATCSGLVASALTRRGDIFPNPTTTLPADIAAISS